VSAGHRRVRADGSKELVALADGYRESAGSWPTCCVTAPAGACAPWLLAMGRLGFGHSTRSLPRDKGTA